MLKFAELRMICNARIWSLEVYDADGCRRNLDIDLEATADARERLGRYDAGDVQKVNPIILNRNGENVAAIEVEVNM